MADTKRAALGSSPTATSCSAPRADRRQVLHALAGMAGIAVVGGGLTGCTIAELKNQGGPPPAEGVSFNLSDAAFQALSEVGGMVPLDAGSLKILLIRADEGQVVALERLCPHEFCDMSPFSDGGVGSWEAETKLLWCNCHISKFSADGTKVEGPADRDLEAYPVTFDPETGEGLVEVAVEMDAEMGMMQGLSEGPVVLDGRLGDALDVDLSQPAFAPLQRIGGAVPVDVDGQEVVIVRRAAIGPRAFEVLDRRPDPYQKVTPGVDTRPVYRASHDLNRDTLTITLAL